MESPAAANFFSVIPKEIQVHIFESYLPFCDQKNFSFACRQSHALAHEIPQFINQKVCRQFLRGIEKNDKSRLTFCEKPVPHLTAIVLPATLLDKSQAETFCNMVENNHQIEKLEFHLKPEALQPLLLNRITEVINKCTRLRFVEIDSVSGILKCLQNRPNLEVLKLDKKKQLPCPSSEGATGLHMALAEVLKGAPRLQTLHADGDYSVTPLGLAAFSEALRSCSRLTKLDLSTELLGRWISDEFMKAVTHISSLEDLKLKNCSFQSEAARSLKYLWTSHPSLRSLSLSGCSTKLDRSRKSLSISKKIERLNVSGTCQLGEEFTESVLAALSDPHCGLKKLEISRRFLSTPEYRARFFTILGNNRSLKKLTYSGLFADEKAIGAARQFLKTNTAVVNFTHKKVLFERGKPFPTDCMKENPTLKSVTLTDGDIDFETLVDLIKSQTSLEILTVRIQLLFPTATEEVKSQLKKILTALSSNKTLKRLNLMQALTLVPPSESDPIKQILRENKASDRVFIIHHS